MGEDTIHILTNETFRKDVLCSERPVLVEFSTVWCGTSHMIAPILSDMAARFGEGIKFCRIDSENYEELASQYGVNRIPTILYFRKGEVVDFDVGAISRDALSRKLTQLAHQRKEPS